VDPAAAGTPGEELGDLPSVSEVLSSGVGRYFSFEFGYDQAMLMFQPVGGMDSIPKAIAAAVGKEKILLRSKVTKITDLADGVEVEYQDRNGRTRKIKADFCVAAMPPHILAKTPHNLGPDVQAADDSAAERRLMEMLNIRPDMLHAEHDCIERSWTRCHEGRHRALLSRHRACGYRTPAHGRHV